MNKLIPALAASLLLLGTACSSDNVSAMNGVNPQAGQRAEYVSPTRDCPEQSQSVDTSYAPVSERASGSLAD